VVTNVRMRATVGAGASWRGRGRLVLACALIGAPFAAQAQALPQPAPSELAVRRVNTNAALSALDRTSFSAVVRDGYLAPGDAPALTYHPSASACSVNAGAGDGGSQVPTSDGGCWLAAWPASGLDVREFGARCDGTTDDSRSFQAALNAAASATVNKVFVPAMPTPCVVTGLVENSANSVSIGGPAVASNAGRAATLQAATRTGTVLEVDVVSGFSISNLRFTSASQQSAGQYVYLNGPTDTWLKNVYFLHGFDPLYLNNANIVRWDGGANLDWSDVGITATGSRGDPNGGSADIYISNTVMNEELVGRVSTYNPVACLLTSQSGGAITLTGNDWIHCHNGFVAAPTTGQFVSWFYIANSYFDSCDYPPGTPGAQTGGIGIKLAPSGSGIINGGSIENGWSSTCTNNLVAQGSGGSIISGLKLVNFESLNAYQDAVYLDDVTDVSISNATITGASQSTLGRYSGLHIGPHGAGHITVTGGRIGGPSEKWAISQKFNLEIDRGFAGVLTVNGVDLSGALTAPVFFASSAPGVTIVNSPGYNPVGIVAVTLGASPTTYTAGASPETLMIPTGSITTAKLGAYTVCSSTPCVVPLAPNQTTTIAYPGATPPAFANRQ